MKKIFYFVAIAALVCGCVEEVPDEGEAFGKIYGTIKDVMGEPIRGASVQLNTGANPILGDDGQYEFTDLKAGSYTLTISKTGYTAYTKPNISVASGKSTNVDVQLEKLPMALRIIDAAANDIDTLDFGAAQGIATRTFSIFNDNPTKLKWWISEDCSWITSVGSSKSGKQTDELPSGGQEPIQVSIDGSRLEKGVHSYILNINSDNGSSELTIIAGEATDMPILTTQPVGNVTASTATFNGTIISPGLPPYTERGFVYAKAAQPTLENCLGKLTVEVSSSATFSANVTGLDANTTYYVRAYAVSPEGEAYGGDESFTAGIAVTELSISAATNLGASSATLNATIISAGAPAYSERGFCYNKTGNPATSDTKRPVAAGDATGSYSLSVTGLDFQTAYYVRAYAIQNGVSVYSADVISFTTTWTNAEVSTAAPADVGATSATLRGAVTNAGNPEYSERGFCYNKTGNPTISNKVIAAGTGEGDYSLDISNLDIQATYYVCSYVLQNGAPIYGNTESFTTVWVETDVSTYAATNIEANNATFNGVINNMGQPECSEHGFVYSATRTTPTIGDAKVTFTGYATAYSANVTGLASNQTYYVRAYAIQTGDPNPVYGPVVQFTTGTPPQLQTLQVGEVSKVNYINATYSLFATLNGNVTDAGSPAYTERGFVYKIEDLLYNTPPTYERDMVVTVPTTGTGAFSTATQQLNHMEWYVVRAYVKTATGVVYYGGAVTFDTWSYTEY